MAPLTDPQAEKLRRIHDIPALVQYLHDELGWPIEATDWEDLVFDWQPEELNLKPEHQVKIRAIKQLRPLVTGQPWGIFFVDFDKGVLPITVLRRVLNGLVPKGRAKGGGHQTWHARDLLFVSTFGQGSTSHPREIALAHFTDESDVGDLPTLRVLGWDAEDTGLQLAHVASTLQRKLRWPQHTTSKADQNAWRTEWASAFRLQYRQVVNDSKTLAITLAELAKRIRSRVNTVLALESERGHLRQLHKAFKDNLIADLSDDGFADMFAQTITYGLFAARASRGSGALVADDAALMAPNTNPFLKELLQDFLHAGGRAKSGAKRVDFDELGINDVVATLREVPMDDVLRSFNAAKPGDDPVIHFYELFLKEYDKKLRAKRGVFYTPRPVVQFIVRSVDEILKTEFDIEDGLASTITWGEMMQRRPELKLPKHCTPQTPFVQILDPATGTATFIVEVIEHVHAHMLGVWRKQGLVKREQWLPKWNEYARLHLLPRLYAFELMMAPYAIAHMKIGIKLAETGYTFPDGGPRVNVFLTNALEPAHQVNPGLEFEAPMLAHEASAANQTKQRLASTVVIGNPPYSGISNNMFPWIDGLLKGQLPDGTVVKSYYEVDGRPLGEKKVWLQDDYVKFIRYGQWRIENVGLGVLGFITNHGYVDNPTFRGMRQCLTSTFTAIDVLDLHGNTKKKEKSPDGSADVNVFDIEQGVAIGLMRTSTNATFRHADLFGSRQAKYEALLRDQIDFKTRRPVPPNYVYSSGGDVGLDGYDLLWPVPSIAPLYGLGFQTSRDDLVVAFSETQLQEKVRRFTDVAISDKEIRRDFFGDKKVADYESGDTRQWSLGEARRKLRSDTWKRDIRACIYRPFDSRVVLYRDDMVDWPRPEVLGHMLAPNHALLVNRQTKDDFAAFWAAALTERKIAARYDASSTFPIWLYSGKTRVPNLSSSFLLALRQALKLAISDYSQENIVAPLHPEKIFHYIYAVLHSPAYRQRYAAFLRTDFPRIPIPGSRQVFDALAQLGADLVAWHLLEHQDAIKMVAYHTSSAMAPSWFGLDQALTQVAEKGRELADTTPLAGSGRADVLGKVFVNATSGFANVRQSVWQHTIGGYQVLHKWLDDRRKAGRSLSQDDITHWLRVYAALAATQKLMLQVDEAIEANGGWPGAFSQIHPPPDAATLAAEQQKVKDQLKAQKKLAGATKKRATYASPTGASSLFDDLEDPPNAAGEPPRPKARATPAKAAGGKAFDEGRAMCAIRRVLTSAGGSGLSRYDLIRSTARDLGHARTNPALKVALDAAVRRAVRRGIAANAGGVLTLLAKDMVGFDRDHLKAQLLSAIRAAGGSCAKADAPMLLARFMGFARTGASIAAVVESLVRSLVRTRQVESRAGQIRVIRVGAVA